MMEEETLGSDQKVFRAPTHQPKVSPRRHLENSVLLEELLEEKTELFECQEDSPLRILFSESPGLIKFVSSPRLDVGGFTHSVERDDVMNG
ncbi:hypothetical protein CDAR_414311 [Caerostris darwini]|uniref:Uncharacterized protein n=1 Tax=Caerostris darwini TaxID=1538125 RepID=A0AAV4RCB1_9ARAC|nr:hypothetical protein CDAR_414311 [Caerostris darwini]